MSDSGESNSTPDTKSSDDVLQSLNKGFRRKRSLLRKPSAKVNELVPKEKFEDEPVAVASETKASPSAELEPVMPERPKLSIDTIPTWIRATKSFELFMLPFTEVPYPQDTFEQALFVLYRRGWRLLRIWFLHYFVLGPIYWPSIFGGYRKLSLPVFISRWFLVLGLPAVVYFGAPVVFELLYYPELALPFTNIAVSAYALIHYIGCHDAFHVWKLAYREMSDQLRFSVTKR